jgi:uncharacterized protein (DUF924 family)
MPDADTWSEAVLHFWFSEVGEPGWFAKNSVLDAEIATRFAAVYEHLSTCPIDHLEANPRIYLAAVVVLDQFSRNMFRGSPRAFATDPLALSLAQRALQVSFDLQLAPEKRPFMYLPYEHNETLAMQVRSLQLFTEFGDANQLSYAQQHHDIIARFGRFPHRNAILGRTSTAEEVEFLKQHAGF